MIMMMTVVVVVDLEPSHDGLTFSVIFPPINASKGGEMDLCIHPDFWEITIFTF